LLSQKGYTKGGRMHLISFISMHVRKKKVNWGKKLTTHVTWIPTVIFTTEVKRDMQALS
jgi:hypothetical protein